MMQVASSPDVPFTPRTASVLVVDDDPTARETTRLALRRFDIHVHEADTGAAAIRAIRSRQFDLALIDFRLPDISGLDIIVELKKDGISVPWMLMSGWMTTSAAVEAMRLGAVGAVDLPFDIETVVIAALRDASKCGANRWPRLPSTFVVPPKSAAERWASLLLRGCSADDDPKTIQDWALVAGVSYSALTESCRLVGMRPHDARDFLRLLRALFRANGRVENLEHGLNVNDHRTLRALFERAGLTMGRSPRTISLPEYIERQQFVDPASQAVTALLKMIERG